MKQKQVKPYTERVDILEWRHNILRPLLLHSTNNNWSEDIYRPTIMLSIWNFQYIGILTECKSCANFMQKYELEQKLLVIM